MTPEEAKLLYKDKYFYEIVKVKSGRNAGTIQLFGPFDNIRYVTKCSKSSFRGWSSDENPQPEWKFCQVIDGEIKQVFTEKEILVTNRIL